MIPKKIHYCWFGGNPLPKLAQKCIKSWKKYCPDYEIIEWNGSNFDINCNSYVKEAYEAKKWAFVTDYVRLWVLYNYGGVYMDTDVEVVKRLDVFLQNKGFTGFERETNMVTGIMASEKGVEIFKFLLSYYDDRHFIKSDGSFDITTNTSIITSMLEERGFIPNGKLQKINEFALYPKEYFCPKEFYTGKIRKTKNTVCIHHFNASWHSEKEKKYWKNRRKRFRKEQRKDYIIHMPNRVLLKLLGNDKYNQLKSFVKKTSK